MSLCFVFQSSDVSNPLGDDRFSAMFLNPDFQVDEESEVKQTYIAQVFYNIYQDALNVRMFLRSRNWNALKKMVDKPVLNCHPTMVPLWIRDSENRDKFLPRITEFWVPLILYQNVACCTTFYDIHVWKWVWKKIHLHIQGWVLTVVFENEAKDKSAIASCLMSLSWSLFRKGQNNWTLLLNVAQLTNVPRLKGLTFSAFP